MNKSLKIAAVAAVLFLALGAVVFVYANSQNGLMINADDERTSMENMFTFSGWNNCSLSGRMRRMPQMEMNDLQLGSSFFENATLSTVQGTVVSRVRGILILNTDSSQIRVSLPRQWTVNNEVVSRTTLFNGTFASQGQLVTVKVLESDIFSNANFSINVMLGYEAINASGTHAYAVLPFNIQPNS